MKRLYSLFFFGAAACIASKASALNAPTGGVAAPAGPATIALSWTDASSDESGFDIERHNGSGWDVVGTVPANQTYYYDRGLSESTSYTYRVRAVNDSTMSEALSLGSAATTLKMNIIFFLADDMGYKDIVALRNPVVDGPTIHETPALDTLASEAMIATNAYCSGPRCVVARRTIQTGKYDWRPEAVPNSDYYVDHHGDPTGGGLWAGGVTVDGSKAGAGVAIPLDNETYGEALQAAGYRTCFIGKYHLGESAGYLHTPTGYSFGDQPGRGPIDQGYHVSIGSGHAGAPPSSYFSVENTYAPGTYTFELLDLDDASYGTSATAQGEYITDRLTDKAIGFMDDVVNNFSNTPFCLTLAHYAVHTPAEAKAADITYFQNKKVGMAADFAAHPAGASGLITDYSVKTRVWQDNAVYAAMMRSYDESLADLRAYLAATDDPRYPSKKLSETTILVVSSDHGGKSTTPLADNKSLEDDSNDPFNPTPVFDESKGVYKSGTPNAYSSYPTSNYPFRQGKTWVYEGGLKVPLIVYYPGLTPAGGSTDAFIHHADLFASFVDMAGGTQSVESTDSVSFMLSASQPNEAARDELFHFFTNSNKGTGNPAIGAYRKGDYKLLYFMVQRRVELYNLAADPHERHDLATERPELAAEMLDALYQEVLSHGTKMPKPGSNSWTSEQNDVLVRNGVIASLPATPDAKPTWDGAGYTVLSPTSVELSWVVNASNATHSVIYRRADAEGETSYREYAYVPVGVTTFRDVGLIAGGQYRYRVESENLGGWYEPSSGDSHTGNKTVSLPATGTSLTIEALDDVITTVPGESRRFNPLLNDEGEGSLEIIAITQPTQGSAAIDGSWIRYQAPEGFGGEVTMTYMIEDSAGQSDTATITFKLPVVEAVRSLERWDYNDPAPVRFDSTLSQNDLAFSSIDSDSILTDGADHLVFSVASGIDDSSRNTTATVSGGPYVTGKFRLEYAITSADLTGSADNLAVGFAFRDNTVSANQKDFGLLRIRKVADGAGGSEIHLQLQVYNGGGYTVTTLHDFNALTLADVTLAAELDMDADPMMIETFLSEGGAEFQSLGSSTANPNAVSFDRLKIQSNISGMAGDDSIRIDYLELTELVSEASLYTNWSSAYPWNGVLDRASDEDPDGDGLTNFMEFAFGTDPLVADGSAPVELVDNGGLTMRFTPIRDTSVLGYTIRFADDLADGWDTFVPITVTSSAGVPVEAALPAGDRGFGKVDVSEL